MLAYARWQYKSFFLFLLLFFLSACQPPESQLPAERPADFLVRPDDWPETRYEAKARREGREVWYFRYRRT